MHPTRVLSLRLGRSERLQPSLLPWIGLRRWGSHARWWSTPPIPLLARSVLIWPRSVWAGPSCCCGCAGGGAGRQGPSQAGGVQVLQGLESLSELNLCQEKLLLAIGQRQLARAVALTPGAVHHARLLPHGTSLQQAMAAGLAPNRVACLRPGSAPGGASCAASLEEALVRQWGITTILARQSGGVTEACWRDVAQRLSLTLLLLQRPDEPEGVPAYDLADLLGQLLERIAKLVSSQVQPTKP